MLQKRHCWGHNFQRGNQTWVKWAHNADSTASSASAAVATAHGDAHSLATCGKEMWENTANLCIQKLNCGTLLYNGTQKWKSAPSRTFHLQKKKRVELLWHNCNFTTPLFKLQVDPTRKWTFYQTPETTPVGYGPTEEQDCQLQGRQLP